MWLLSALAPVLSSAPWGALAGLWRQVPHLTPRQIVMRALLIIVGFSLLATLLQQGVALINAVGIEQARNATATVQDANCRIMSPEARYDPGVDYMCKAAARVLATSPYYRAFETMVASWWGFDALLAKLLETIQARFVVLCALLLVGMVAWQYLGQPLANRLAYQFLDWRTHGPEADLHRMVYLDAGSAKGPAGRFHGGSSDLKQRSPKGTTDVGFL